ncbi:MAG: hypothetical protein FJW96_07160, partial [Actinobacteria bacterium]|nr:hypothetical protein [Actinomycetota bacterium]
MIGRKRLAAGELVESAALKRERASIEKLRSEIGERLEEVKRRETALESRLRALEESGAAPPDDDLRAGVEERSLELDRR